MDGSKNSGFVVEQAIPLPGGKASASPFPFEGMKVGDSFLVPTSADVSRSRIVSASTYSGHRRNHRYSVRKVAGGIRVWRVE